MTESSATEDLAFARVIRERPALYLTDATAVGSIHLPILPPGKLVGRERDLDFIVDTVTNRTTQLLTILGPGGVGKTRLAVTAAWHLAHLFRDGAYFIQFSSTPPADLGAMFGQHLSISNPSGEHWTEVLGEAIRSREMLLVLDNCEYVIEDLVRHIPILASSPNLMVIATSQQPFQIDHEQEYWLQPLTLPEAREHAPLASLQESTAFDLFMLRARRSIPEFEPTEEDADDIAAIVRLVDGLPLAVELAAAQLRHLTPSGLRQRLEHALPSLSGELRNIPERQRSLVGMTSWTLSLLSTQDRETFLKLTALEGNFTAQAAATVMNVPLTEAWDKLMLFADKSLIKREARSDSTPLFFMLQTVHATAGQMLQEEPELHRAAMHQLGVYFLDLAREFQLHAHGPQMTAWLDQMDLELRGIQAFITRAQHDSSLLPTALEMVEPMFWYWYSRSHHSWALKRIENLLDTADDAISPDHIGAAHIAAGWLAFKQTHLERAAWHFRKGNELLTEPASPVALRGQIGLAFILAAEGDNKDEALAILQDEVRLASGSPGAWHELSSGHFGIAQLHYYHGQYADALPHLDTILRISRANGDAQSIGLALLFLAQIDRHNGDYANAIRQLQEALPSFVTAADNTNLASCIDFIMATLLDAGEPSLARRVGLAGEHIRKANSIPRTPLDIRDLGDALNHIRVNGSRNASTDIPGESLDLVLEEFLAFDPDTLGKDGSAAPDIESVLSTRELEVLRLISTGKTMPQVADALFVSPHTIKRHMANVRSKLGVRSQAAAVAMLRSRQ